MSANFPAVDLSYVVLQSPALEKGAPLPHHQIRLAHDLDEPLMQLRAVARVIEAQVLRALVAGDAQANLVLAGVFLDNIEDIAQA